MYLADNHKLQAEGLKRLNFEILKLLKELIPQLNKYKDKKLLTNKGFVKGFNRIDTSKYFRYQFDGEWIQCDYYISVGDSSGYYFVKNIKIANVEEAILKNVAEFNEVVKAHKLNHIVSPATIKRQLKKYNELQKEINKLYFDMDINIRSINNLRMR